jgi:hypothetical protein
MLLGFRFSTDRTIDSISVSFYHLLWDFWFALRLSPGLPAKFRKAAIFLKKLRESIAEAGIVTAPVTVPAKWIGLLFLSAEYYSEGEAVVNTLTVMIRVKLNGKYPYLPAFWSRNGRLNPKVALVSGNEWKVEGQYDQVSRKMASGALDWLVPTQQRLLLLQQVKRKSL